VATTRKPARTAKAKPKVEVEVDEDEELDELDELDELEALADEPDDEPEEDEDEEEEDEEDEDEDVPKSRRKSKTSTKAKTKTKRKSETYGTSALADDLETDGKNLRVMLRDLKANRLRKKGTTGSFNDAGRYEWSDLDDALDTLGFDSVEDAIDRLRESRNTRLDALKERNAGKKKAKAKKAPEPEPDEDEDEDEEDDEEEAPPKRTSRRRSSRK
jgi:hypothetical protein